RALVSGAQSREGPIEPGVEAAWRPLRRGRAARMPPPAEEARAHHRGHRERDRELFGDPADDAGCDVERYEGRNERQAHREHRETDLARGIERGAYARLAGLDMADDVLHHDDRVI